MSIDGSPLRKDGNNMAKLIKLDGSLDHGALKAITAVIDKGDGGEQSTVTLNSDNPKFGEVKDLLAQYQTEAAAGDVASAIATSDAMADLILTATDLAGQVHDKFEKLDLLNGRLTRNGNNVYLDYEPIDPVLEKEIIKALDENDDATWRALAAFIARLYSNMTEYVRDQLFSWLEATFKDDDTHGFNILPDGRFVGYKGCEYDSEGNIVSRNTGFAISNGEQYNGHIPNPKGAIVEMPRKMVQDDPATACSTGLHVGTWGYASAFSGGAILTVAVDPADVVSIPTDCDGQKLRCCRYEVIDVVKTPVRTIMDDDWYGSDEDVDGGWDDPEEEGWNDGEDY